MSEQKVYKLLEDVRAASLTDVITDQALAAYTDPMDAVCSALLVHIKLTENLIKECTQLRAGALVQVVVNHET